MLWAYIFSPFIYFCFRTRLFIKSKNTTKTFPSSLGPCSDASWTTSGSQTTGWVMVHESTLSPLLRLPLPEELCLHQRACPGFVRPNSAWFELWTFHHIFGGNYFTVYQVSGAGMWIHEAHGVYLVKEHFEINKLEEMRPKFCPQPPRCGAC